MRHGIPKVAPARLPNNPPSDADDSKARSRGAQTPTLPAESPRDSPAIRPLDYADPRTEQPCRTPLRTGEHRGVQTPAAKRPGVQGRGCNLIGSRKARSQRRNTLSDYDTCTATWTFLQLEHRPLQGRDPTAKRGVWLCRAPRPPECPGIREAGPALPWEPGP